jgi:hypothetical protein
MLASVLKKMTSRILLTLSVDDAMKLKSLMSRSGLQGCCKAYISIDAYRATLSTRKHWQFAGCERKCDWLSHDKQDIEIPLKA